MDTKGKVYMIFFQDDTRILRRVMYEKRPVIENKLLSGRQVLASEPTPSDTSDSDSEYPEYYDHGQQRFLFEHRENLSNQDKYVCRNVSS